MATVVLPQLVVFNSLHTAGRKDQILIRIVTKILFDLFLDQMNRDRRIHIERK